MTPRPEDVQAVATAMGSFPMHEDDRGPDNTVLIDLLPCEAADDAMGETCLYRLVNHTLATLLARGWSPPGEQPKESET